MNLLIILSKLEEEYLVRASESAIHVRKLRQFFLWTQGQLQGLLPHQLMVCIQFGDNDEVLNIECLDNQVRDAELTKQLCHRENGLAIRLARYCRSSSFLPCMIEHGANDAEHPLSLFHTEVTQHGLRNAVAHGTEQLRGGATFFALFSLVDAATPRHAFFLELLLPHLHLAFQRAMAANDGPSTSHDTMHPLTARELDILNWVMKGKSNYEIGAIVNLSPLTVKNHLQNIYKKLNVHNRVQAISRCYSLQLLNPKTREAKSKRLADQVHA
jgi:transcriptional regulator EpsA